MCIEGQGHFFTIFFPGFVCYVLYLAKISGERLQDHRSSGFCMFCCFFRFSFFFAQWGISFYFFVSSLLFASMRLCDTSLLFLISVLGSFMVIFVPFLG